MTNTIESLTKHLTSVRSQIAASKAEEKTLLQEIAKLALEESGSETGELVTPAMVEMAKTSAPSKKPSGKKPDPKSKRQRAFRLFQKNWSNKAVAKALKLREEHVSAYRRELKRGANVAGV